MVYYAHIKPFNNNDQDMGFNGAKIGPFYTLSDAIQNAHQYEVTEFNLFRSVSYVKTSIWKFQNGKRTTVKKWVTYRFGIRK